MMVPELVTVAALPIATTPPSPLMSPALVTVVGPPWGLKIPKIV